jgi:hypothetical protein
MRIPEVGAWARKEQLLITVVEFLKRSALLKAPLPLRQYLAHFSQSCYLRWLARLAISICPDSVFRQICRI